MKKLNTILFVMLASMALIFTQCSKEKVVGTISGGVTYLSTMGAKLDAAGAIITVYKGTTAGDEYAVVVADDAGLYSVKIVEKGDYHLVATYSTENQNLLKSDGVDGVSFQSEGVTVNVKKDDVTQDITVGSFIEVDDVTVSLVDGWEKESHSKITWKTLYHGDAAQLTGGFGNFGLYEFEFDADDPASTVIRAWVQLTSISTFEPARDGLGGCVPEDLGVLYNEADTAADGSLNASAVDASTDTAWFTSTSVEEYGNGYLAKGVLDFKGVEGDVDLFFVYNGTYMIEARGGGGSNPFAVFEGEFTFDAVNDYAVEYSGGDEIEVNIHLQMKGAFVPE